MRPLVPLLCIACFALACDKPKEKSKDDDDDGVSVDDFCDKTIELQNKMAKANGKKDDDDGPPPAAIRMTCKSIFNRAKKEEPKAYACMADCTMAAKTLEAEQKCIDEKKCLKKAKNPKLLGNQAD